MELEWKTIDGFEDYEVSNYGDVRKAKTKKDIILQYDQKGCSHVILYKKNERKRCIVARLVANAFLPNPDNLPFVVKKPNWGKSCDMVTNLEWSDDTHKYKGKHNVF